MDIKRVLTSVVGLPIVVIALVLGNEYIMGIILMLIGIISMKEYLGVVSKVAHPIKWVGYLSTVLIFLASILEANIMMTIVAYSLPFILLVLFLKVIITDMETTFKDVAYTFLGIGYITICIMFLSLIRGLDNGKIIFAYTLLIAWSTDIWAYVIGKRFGKHKFSKISPKKSIEGCIAGILAAVIFSLIFILILHIIKGENLLAVFVGYEFSWVGSYYFLMAGIALVFSAISQIGDFIASSIKRFSDIKDYGNLLPGHGGMLDRIDSVIFLAPFIFMVFNLI